MYAVVATECLFADPRTPQALREIKPSSRVYGMEGGTAVLQSQATIESPREWEAGLKVAAYGRTNADTASQSISLLGVLARNFNSTKED